VPPPEERLRLDDAGRVMRARVNSRFLTGPSARFGMTKFILGCYRSAEALRQPGFLRG
jgi:hypothetical protein